MAVKYLIKLYKVRKEILYGFYVLLEDEDVYTLVWYNYDFRINNTPRIDDNSFIKWL